ncbi:MAG: hypothetical protein IBX45_02640 [Campylobacterales bacterium]|nr:hypothetical protein [Campylobacterales bacterium]
MNLPHLPPVRFAHTLSHKEGKEARVQCAFPVPPTLPMLIEAAAQSSAAFREEGSPLMGFLVLCKEVRLHVKPTQTTCILCIEERLCLGEMSEFSFKALLQDETLLATGFVTIAHPKA